MESAWNEYKNGRRGCGVNKDERQSNYTDKVLNGIEKSFRVCIVLCMKFEKTATKN